MMHAVKEPLAGLALLVIFGFLIWYNRPNESSRPFDPYPQHQAPRVTGDVYEAWLWKDPFGVSSAAIDAVIPYNQKPLGKKHEKKSERSVQGYKICQDQIQDRLRKILDLDKELKEGDKRKPVILAPLVKVTPDTVENKELRTRQRYAVVAGLIESGYRPQEPDRLHFCSIQEDNREYDMRWEHYRHESKDNSKDNSKDSSKDNPEDKPDIVVAWIDSETLTAEDKFPPGNNCTPSCNFPFKNLVKAISKDNKFYLFDLNDILGQDRSKSIRDHIECIRTSRSDKRCVEKIRLIKPAGKEGETGNQGLAKKLADEMELRCIKDPSELIIVTEHGLDNAAELANSLTKFLRISFEKKESDKPKCNTASSAAGAGEIRKIFYLKGLDGNPEKTRTQEKKDKDENQSDDKPEHVPVIDLHRPPLLPIGPGQMDYFHRLAEEIRNVHDTVDYDKRDSGAKAVIILGSDFNDKLLIIEALRDKLPHLLILTTDLDAQMLYSKHWRSTRNLVVASHFNLGLREKSPEDKNETDKDYKSHFWQRAYQDQFSPFRDSQQTNIFYRTLSIAQGNAVSIYQSDYTFPRIFEVGRNGFVRLGDLEKNRNSSYHPSNNTLKQTEWRLYLLLVMTLCLIWFYYALRPRFGIATVYLVVGALFIFAIPYLLGMNILGMGESGEPLSFTDGVSLWPTILLQIVAILWAVAFFVLTICELDKNSWLLSDRYFPGARRFLSVYGAYDRCQDQCQLWANIRPYITWSSKMRSVKGWVTFFFFAVSIIVYAYNDVYPRKLTLLWCLVILGVIAFVYVKYFWENVSIKRWAEDDQRIDTGDDNNIDRISGMWWRYFRLGRFGHRLARVIGMWLIFAIIETLLVYLLPPWPLPWRGDRDPASFAGVLSFVVTMLLLFFILDAVRLNYYWIKKLRHHHWQICVRQRRQACSNSLLEALEDIVEVVAARTQAVDKLIYYPMLCIVLMLFAKITYFDNQDLPLSKGITFGAAISFLFFSGFMLRHEANQLRLSIRKDVQDRTVAASCTQDRKQETLTRLDTIDEGAFQPMLEQPVMQALLIVLASIGLFAGEYLKLFG